LKRVIFALFFFACIAIPLLGGMKEAYAEPLPMVVCQFGKCVMAEADWKKLKDYHKAVHASLRNLESATNIMQKIGQELHAKLARCEAHLRQRNE
jgi:hypothetical protein